MTNAVTLTIAESPRGVTATITAPAANFVGAVLVSDQPQLTYYLVGLPPLLSSYEVVLLGVTDTDSLNLFLPLSAPLPSVDYFTQGVVYDGQTLLSSEVVLFHPGS